MRKSIELEILEGDGVDNWTWYMEGESDTIKSISESILKRSISEEELENFCLDDIAKMIVDCNYTECECK